MNTKKVLIISVCILCITVFCLTFKQSFAYVLNYKSQSTADINRTTLTSYTTSISTSGLSSINITPMSDADGLAQEDCINVTLTPSATQTYFRLQINYYTSGMTGTSTKYVNNNTFTTAGSYDELASSGYWHILNTTTSKSYSYEYSNVVSPALVRLAVFSSTGSQVTQPVSLSELPITSAHNATGSSNPDLSSVYFKFFEGLLAASTSATYKVKLWLDEDANKFNCYKDTNLSFSISVYSEPSLGKEKLTLTPTVSYSNLANSTFTALSGANVTNLVNGKSYNSTSTGTTTSFILYTGETYSFRVSYNGNDYIVPLNVKYSESTSTPTITNTYYQFDYTKYNNPYYFAYVTGNSLDSIYTNKVAYYYGEPSTNTTTYYSKLFNKNNRMINTTADCAYLSYLSSSYAMNYPLSTITLNQNSTITPYMNIASTSSITDPTIARVGLFRAK